MKSNMIRNIRSLVAGLSMIGLMTMLGACATGGGGGSVAGNDGGSQPVNQKETVEYQKAVLKCYKTGGSRVVKVTGELRCF